jgi:hypothetical protein
METTKDILYFVTACKRTPILMGDESPFKVIRKGRVELNHGRFENVMHVPQISVNVLSMN